MVELVVVLLTNLHSISFAKCRWPQEIAGVLGIIIGGLSLLGVGFLLYVG